MGYQLSVYKLTHKENISLSHVPGSSKYEWLADAAYEYLNNYPYAKSMFTARVRGGTADLVLNSAPSKVKELPFAEVYTEKQGHNLLKKLEESHESWPKYTKKVKGKAPHGYLVVMF